MRSEVLAGTLDLMVEPASVRAVKAIAAELLARDRVEGRCVHELYRAARDAEPDDVFPDLPL